MTRVHLPYWIQLILCPAAAKTNANTFDAPASFNVLGHSPVNYRVEKVQK